MKIIVQKFGGTSLKDDESRRRAAKHVKDAVTIGYKVVVVVSAIGRKGDPYATDTLLGLIGLNEAKVTDRELDLLLSCGETISSVVFSNLLIQSGLNATAITGAQAGFRTNDDYQNARIIDMQSDRLLELLKDSDVIVVTGFQGQSSTGEVTTIGRGGSDTSAAALGAALQSESIDIFTDVDGVMTADPHIVSEARPLSVVTYNEICNMAYQGAKVIHPRAVEIAMQAKIPIRIRSTNSTNVGTLVSAVGSEKPGRDVQERIITGIAYVEDVCQFKVFAKEEQLDWQKNVFKAMAENKISVDFINIYPKGVVYTVKNEFAAEAIQILKQIGYEPEVTTDCAKVSAVGAGIAGVPGVTAKIVNALAAEGIEILQSADSHTTIWVLVNQNYLNKAVNALHRAFQLEKEFNDQPVDYEKKRE